MSKFKAAATATLPEDLLNQLSSTNFAAALFQRVLMKHLLIDDPFSRPAEHFVQKCDHTVYVGEEGIELTLSKISVRNGRDFAGALETMQQILTEAVEVYCTSDQTVQIFCVIATDTPVPGTTSTLYEMEKGVWVRGKRDLNPHADTERDS